MLGLATQLLALRPDAAAAPSVSVVVDAKGIYTVHVDGAAWYQSPSAGVVVCVEGKQRTLAFESTRAARGRDSFGAWTGTSASYGDASVNVAYTFKSYAAKPSVAVGTMSFTTAVNTSGCGSTTTLSSNNFMKLSTYFPSFNTSFGKASSNNFISWCGETAANSTAARGLAHLGNNALDCGPVVSSDPTDAASTTLVWSSLTSHKILPQQTTSAAYAMGIAGAIPTIPAGFEYSAVFVATRGGATAGMYGWGSALQAHYNTTRLPSATLKSIGYYTDDGAYYYVWGGAKELRDPELSPWIPPRPWAAEAGLVLVKEKLYELGVPVAYMQLDDWWYQGPFHFGNVKSVVDWHASNSPGLFPSGLPAFAAKLGLPLQLYTPFFNDAYKTPYKMTESTTFPHTKVVSPHDAYPFFSDLFDLGLNETMGHFNTYEIDFLDVNFKGCTECFADVHAADAWYQGLNDAALERNISLQYCLASSTDLLESLTHPAVIQARASGDYARPNGQGSVPWSNTITLGPASLLFGALAVAPSKDTFWTASPQPATSSDRAHSEYVVQPHVDLDAILAVLSMGPVGIGDGLGATDAGLIRQGFTSATDGTLLRPSRPLSSVDATWANRSAGTDPCIGAHFPAVTCSDVRSTSALVGDMVSHYVLAWMTAEDVTLQATDLYPAPASRRLATRVHVVAPATIAAQQDGCVDGHAAAPRCLDFVPAGRLPVIPAVGFNNTKFSLTAVYEQMSNGAWFLGELGKFVHVSPQRFASVAVGGKGPSAIAATVRGSSGQVVSLVSVDAKGIVHIQAVTIPASGSVDVEL